MDSEISINSNNNKFSINIFINILVWLDAFISNEHYISLIDGEIAKDLKVLLSRTIVSKES